MPAAPLVSPTHRSGALSASLRSRVRSASPCGRTLAIDFRRIANLLRDAPPVDASAANTPVCESPHSGVEPDRGVGPSHQAPGPMSNARMMVQQQFGALVEKVNVMVCELSRQCEADRRRMSVLERKVESRHEERNHGEGREKWAELQGSVSGLMDETQALTRRMEGLEERLWTRTNGAESLKQRSRELEQQVQSLEQQSRLTAAAGEETHKRQATKLRRAEYALEEASRRLAKVEEEHRCRQGERQREMYLEARVDSLERRNEQIHEDLNQLQIQLDSGLQDLGEVGGGEGDERPNIEDAMQAAEDALGSLEKKVSVQIEDLASSVASLRVKVDGQLQRVGSLAERLQTAHEPAIDSLRGELMQVRSQDRREMEQEIASLSSRVKQATDGNEEAVDELREALRQSHAGIAALSLRPEGPVIGALEDRMNSHEREVQNLCARLESMPALEDRSMEAEPGPLPEEFDDLLQRVLALEDKSDANEGVEKDRSRQVVQLQDTVVELKKQVSRVSQRTSSIETLQNQVQQMQILVEQKQESKGGHEIEELQAKLGAVFEKVADFDARLLEVEGGLEFARENETGIGNRGSISGFLPNHDMSVVSTVSEAAMQASSIPPLPRSEEIEHHCTNMLGEKLEAVAKHLEEEGKEINELYDRVSELEERLSSAGQVSFGRDGGAAASPGLENVVQSVDELRVKLLKLDPDLKALKESAATRDMLAKLETRIPAADKVIRMDQRIGTFEQLTATLKHDVETLDTSTKTSLEAFAQDLKTLLPCKNNDEIPGPYEDRTQPLRLAQNEAEFSELQLRVERLAAAIHVDFAKQIRALEDKTNDAVALGDRVRSVEESVARTSNRVDGDTRARSEVQTKVSDLVAEVAQELQQLSEQRLELAKTKSTVEALSSKIEFIDARQTESGSREPIRDAKLAGEVADLGDRVSMMQATLQDLSKRELDVGHGLAAHAAHGCHEPGGQDTEIRVEVQAQVAELVANITAELRELEEQRQDLANGKTTLQALSSQIAVIERRQTQSATCEPIRDEKLVDEVADLRAQVIKMQVALKDLEQITGGSRKIGITMAADATSPMEVFRGRLEDLSDQVADLNAKVNSSSGSRSVSRSASRAVDVDTSDDSPKAESLDFSLTEQTDRMAGTGKDESLNFSLTEHTCASGRSSPRHHPGNFRSSRGCSPDDSDSSGSPAVSPHGRRLSPKAWEGRIELPAGGDTLDSLVGGSSASSKVMSRRERHRPSPLSVDDEHLAPVAEEDSELLDQSAESQSRAVGSGKNAQLKSPDPLDQSHEVSIGCDVSVEDSLELEKCDHVEAIIVKPLRPVTIGVPSTEHCKVEPLRPGSEGGGQSTLHDNGIASASKPSNPMAVKALNSFQEDFLVEDSLELEKCDHVEPIVLDPRRAGPTGNRSSLVERAHGREDSSSTSSDDAGLLAARLRRNPMAAKVCSEAVSALRGEPGGKEDTSDASGADFRVRGTSELRSRLDEYDDEFDDGSMSGSINESIEEASGSNGGWGAA
mmetsp:Transcript_20374/g.54491  ORF Transcript_20374/g.54491 Transcript_20374/m.54491 type:complete len:1515 (-) Transcript_20374:117-4661(-)